MTREQARNSSRPHAARVRHTARFQLKPTGQGGGYVDGAWWPRSDDLMTELSGLIAALSVRQSAISRVVYKLSEWGVAHAELVTDGRAVQLDGRRGHPPNTVEVSDNKGNTVVLLVVPFHLDPDHAHAIVTMAAAPGNVSRVDTLLMISAKDRESRTDRDAARERWDFQMRAGVPKPRNRLLWQRADRPVTRDTANMTSDAPVFKTFSDFGIDDPRLRRLVDIDDSAAPDRELPPRVSPRRPASSRMPGSNSRPKPID